MINKAMLTIVHPFFYNSVAVAAIGSGDVLSDNDRDDFLPYVSTFFSGGKSGTSPRVLPIEPFRLEIRMKPKAQTSGILPVNGGKIYFLADGVAVLTLSFQFDSLNESDFAGIQRSLSRMDKVNSTVFRPVGSQDEVPWLGTGALYRSLVADYLAPVREERDPFNPFNRSSVISSCILAVDGDYPEKPAFIEALLLNRTFALDNNGTFLSDSVRRVRQSELVESFGNSTGVVFLCRDDGSEFSRSGVFRTYGKNYLLVFLITVYQQARIQSMIDKSSRITLEDRGRKAFRELKDEIITYLARTDYTQISHNPARNLLYKFFRNNFEVKELLDEVAVIVKKIDQELEAEQVQLHAEKAHKGEIIALILEILILPYYLHHIIEIGLKYASHDEHFIHEAAFRGTIGATILVIIGIQLLLRAFRK